MLAAYWRFPSGSERLLWLLRCAVAIVAAYAILGSSASLSQSGTIQYDQLLAEVEQLTATAGDVEKAFEALGSKDIKQAQDQVKELTSAVSDLLAAVDKGSPLDSSIQSGISWAKGQIDRISANESLTDEKRDHRLSRLRSEIDHLLSSEGRLHEASAELRDAYGGLHAFRSDLAEQLLLEDLVSARKQLDALIAGLLGTAEKLRSLPNEEMTPEPGS